MLKPARSPMPPLKALRSFEAAARHSSFLKASEELGVTAGAIAQQVRKLEDWIGQPLFHRHAQGVSLTAEAAQALPALTDAFERLGSTVQFLRGLTSPSTVRIAALPSIAQLWLAPRLAAIKQAFPAVEISVAALEEPPSFAREMYDLAIFYVRRPPKGMRAIPLAEDSLFPVAAPQLQLSEPSELEHQVLLHDTTWNEHWKRWLDAASLTHVPAHRGPKFSLYSLAQQAAVEGGGVLMGRRTLVAGAIAAGRLVKPFALEVPAPDPLALLVPADRDLPSAQSDLLEWLQRN